MEKMKLKLVLMFTIFSIVLIPFHMAFAEEGIETKNNITNTNIISDDTTEPLGHGLYYSKENVQTSYEYSDFVRVSDDLTTGRDGGSISSSKTETFETSTQGEIGGLGFSTSHSISNSIGYTLNVAPYQTAYMGYRVRYKVESGTRVVSRENSTQVTRNSYTIKIPEYGEYKLINK